MEEIINEIKGWLERNENKIRSVYSFTRGGKIFKIYMGACMNNSRGLVYPCVVVANETDNRFSVLTVQKFLDVYVTLKSLMNSEKESEIASIAEALVLERRERKLPAEVV